MNHKKNHRLYQKHIQTLPNHEKPPKKRTVGIQNKKTKNCCRKPRHHMCDNERKNKGIFDLHQSSKHNKGEGQKHPINFAALFFFFFVAAKSELDQNHPLSTLLSIRPCVLFSSSPPFPFLFFPSFSSPFFPLFLLPKFFVCDLVGEKVFLVVWFGFWLIFVFCSTFVFKKTLRSKKDG